MGAVWVAQNRDLGLTVAIKFLHASFAEQELSRKRFEREARLLARIDSPHVVKVFDCGMHEQAPFLVMELLKGEDLNVLLKRERRLSPQRVSRLVHQVAKGLKKAHEAGVIHRDLKPANIFLQEDDDGAVAKVLDFGIARSSSGEQGDTLTESGSTLGSPHYMSPEQARGLPDIDLRTDTWSLGVVAYRALTGRLPFQGQAMGDIVLSVCTAPIPQVAELAPELGPGWDAFFARALARAPEDRFQSARELAAAFSQIAGDPPMKIADEASFPSTDQPRAVEPEPTTRIATSSDARAPQARPTGRRAWWLAVPALAAAGAVVAIGLGSRSEPAPAGGERSTLAVSASASAPASAAPTSAPPIAVAPAESSAGRATSSAAPSASARPPRPAARPPARPQFDFGLP